MNAEVIKDFGGKKIENLDEGLKNCDYLSLHIPLTEKTKNMINYKYLWKKAMCCFLI